MQEIYKWVKTGKEQLISSELNYLVTILPPTISSIFDQCIAENFTKTKKKKSSSCHTNPKIVQLLKFITTKINETKVIFEVHL